MTSVLRPRGPQQASVYWRRRLVALIVAVAVPITLGVLLFGGGGDPGQAGASGPSPSTSPEPTDAPSTDAPTSSPDDPDAEPSETPSPATSPTARTVDAPTCSDDDIAVEAAVDAEVFPAGRNPQITLTISNESDADCLRDIGSGANEIVVSSGGHHAWSSDDCDPSQAANEQLLPAGAQAQVTVTWERKLSAPGCAGQASDAQAGTYQVTARNGDVTSAEERITLQ